MTTPSSQEFRTAARVLRWGMWLAKQQVEEMPFWKRIFVSTSESEFQRLIVLCESEADDLEPPMVRDQPPLPKENEA